MLILSINFAFGQLSEKQDASSNTFAQSEQSAGAPIEPNDEGFPGGPGDPPVPIDNYLPFLFVAAVGIIAAAKTRRKVTSH